eukprot:5100985-Lingulodinium_polyedra.AAC.1
MERLVVGVAERWIPRAARGTKTSLAFLVAGDPATRPRGRAIIAMPGARRTWREDGAKWAPGPDSVLRQAWSARLSNVQK